VASNVVNLGKVRKRKQKAEKEQRADTNRRLHGRTKAERAQEAAQKARLEKAVDGAFLEREPPATGPATATKTKPRALAPVHKLPTRPSQPSAEPPPSDDESE